MTQQHVTYTKKGAVQLATTLNKCLDLFAEIGSARRMAHDEPQRLEDMFIAAYAEDPATALSILFWARAARCGAGEKDVFFTLINTVADIDKDIVLDNLPAIADIGCYKDLVRLYDMFDFCRRDIAGLFEEAIEGGSYYAAKWLPKKHPLYPEVRKIASCTNKEFRKKLKELAPTVERQLCAKKISEIAYNALPSKALNRYKELFLRKDKTRFLEVVNSKGVNASVLFPHDVLSTAYCGMDAGLSFVTQAQWEALPDYLDGNQVLTVLDTSGSMSMELTASLSVSDVATALSVYCAERTCEPFKDKVISFSRDAMFFDLSGLDTAYDKYAALQRYSVVDETNIESVFDLILGAAVKANLPAEKMPSRILILSDMQFDTGTCNNRVGLMDAMRFKFKKHGYQLPAIIYWNLNAEDTGVHGDKYDNIALVSGYSPVVLKAVFAGDVEERLNPVTIMNTAIAPVRKKLFFSHVKPLPKVFTRRDLNPKRSRNSWCEI